ncbi:DUF2798 domain-containing protein [Diaphorobacter sp. HDW4A]|uniref:DUF2798 domain-containing protein n=1 Tax=Diaphorobacter sp. HDW4A TaxID=2714924 RepID=UPI00140C116C|nr:DUF2798 domain-containing protein [Diaphorobacter sp. HDW4A]QIL81101.1 DUF2798 domain-containing protein [Diaphorobacter sp. HDW4A]
MPPSNTANTSPTRPASRKIHRKYTQFVFALYMAAIMALLMCAVIVGVNSGLGNGYLQRVLQTYLLAMPVAFFCVLGVRPVVMKLVAATVDLG